LVYIDGIPSGRTPAKNVTLTPGNHTVHLVNDDAGLELTFQVTITAGELTTVRKNLADP
jgi:hypothetical protein